MAHTQIGPAELLVISRLLRAGYSLRDIARAIDKAQCGHSPCEPQQRPRRIRRAGSTKTEAPEAIAAMDSIRVLKGARLRSVLRMLKEHQSPEQIEGVTEVVSASTIYRYINERAPHLKQFLRSRKGKYRRRRGTKIRESLRERAKKRRIDERPPVVERRSRLGDWEGDTVQRSDKRVRIVTFVDRRSGYLVAYLLPKMRAELLTSLALTHFRHIPRAKRKTITLDNGPEFADWERLEKKSARPCTSPIHTVLGSVAQTRIPTDFFVSISLVRSTST